MGLWRRVSSCFLINGFLSFILLFQLLAPCAHAGDDASNVYTVRDRDTPAGLYESSYSDASHGKRVADLTPEAIQEYFRQESPESFEQSAFDLDDGSEISTTDPALAQETDRRILYVVGVPLFGKERQETLDLVKSLSGQKKMKFSEWLKDLFFLNRKKTETHIRPIGRPAGKWKLLQQLAYPMIWPMDMMPIDQEVMKEGMQSVVISAAIGLTIQLMVQLGEQGNISKALAIVVPTAVLNFLQSAWTSLPRNWWQNYFKRAGAIAAPVVESVVERTKESDRAARIFGSIAQQLWMTFLFTFNVYLVSRGNLSTSLALFSAAGLSEIVQKKWPSMFMNVFWRTPVENAFADYVQIEGDKGRTGIADLEAARIRKFVTILATNLWVYSTLTVMNLDFMGAKWNLGHAGLALMGLAGILAWIKPEMMRKLTKSGRCAENLEKTVGLP